MKTSKKAATGMSFFILYILLPIIALIALLSLLSVFSDKLNILKVLF